jgi:hypothetical protein
MIDQKQPPVFAKTVRELRRRGCRFQALVAGDGPLLPWLRRFVWRNRLRDVVRFLGSLPNRAVAELVPAVDVIFLPSKNEGIAAAFYEAMAAGVPVVGANVGGQRELVTPECGVLVERGSEDVEVQRYADVLAPLLEDPERRRRMGEAGRARIVDGYTLDRLGERIEEVLERASELAGSQPRAAPTPEEAREAASAATRLVPWTSLGPVLVTSSPTWWLRVVTLRILVLIGAPLYRLSLRLGLRWVEPLKQWVIRRLNPGAG